MNAMIDIERLDWEKGAGLIPTIVQNWHSGAVLMLGYMNRDALEQTRETGKVTFWSRSRNCLWSKGETSGNFLALKSLSTDCDGDTILVHAEPHGPTCHLGSASCFGDASAPPLAFLGELDTLIAQRERDRPAGSYVSSLFEKGTRRIAQKVGEEGVETALAAVDQNDEELIGEAADLVFHLMILLRARKLDFGAVVATLKARSAG
jgi:phosphoribosyl-AMP cyclohydrolase / phosphoribosyl-ATP pyrophosphohydrolase